MRVSIITCTFNSERYLQQCIDSVKGQSFPFIEHIFIDGSSKDRTIEIIARNYERPILLSEPDNGIYDAFNKGVALATGDIVGFLHSDDELASFETIQRIVSAFQNKPDAQYYCGRMLQIRPENGSIYGIYGKEPNKNEMFHLMSIAHPTVYCRRTLMDDIGPYTLQYKIAGDVEWCFRLIDSNAPFHYAPDPVVKFRLAGTSTQFQFRSAWEEFIIKSKRYGFRLAFLYSFVYVAAITAIRMAMVRVGLERMVDKIRVRLKKFE